MKIPHGWERAGRLVWRTEPDLLLEIERETYGKNNFYIIRFYDEDTGKTLEQIEHHPGSSESITTISDAKYYALDFMKKWKK